MKKEDVKIGMRVVPFQKSIWGNLTMSSEWHGWYVMREDVELIKESAQTIEEIKVIRNNKATMVILPNGKKGVSKCHPDDTYDESIGLTIAYQKAKGLKVHEYWTDLKDIPTKELLDELERRVTNK